MPSGSSTAKRRLGGLLGRAAGRTSSTGGGGKGRTLFGRSLLSIGAAAASRAQFKEKELRAAFAVFDADGSGALSAAELKAVLTRPGGGAPLTDAEVAALIAEFDVNKNGELEFEEFAAFWAPG